MRAGKGKHGTEGTSSFENVVAPMVHLHLTHIKRTYTIIEYVFSCTMFDISDVRVNIDAVLDW